MILTIEMVLSEMFTVLPLGAVPLCKV
jgi:hypothetical protein